MIPCNGPWSCGEAPSSQESETVGLIGRGSRYPQRPGHQSPVVTARHGTHMHEPLTLLTGGPWTASGQDCSELGHILGFDKQLAERGMGIIGGRWGQHYFRITRKLQIVASASPVGKRDLPDL